MFKKMNIIQSENKDKNHIKWKKIVNIKLKMKKLSENSRKVKKYLSW